MEALIYIGGAALAFAVFGGLGITIGGMTVPKIPGWQRAISAVAGFLFIALGIVIYPEVRTMLWGIPVPTATTLPDILANAVITPPTNTLQVITATVTSSTEVQIPPTATDIPPTNAAMPTSSISNNIDPISTITNEPIPIATDTPQSIATPIVTCFGKPLPHRSPIVGQPWVLPDGGWIIVNFWSNEPGIDQTEHKLLLSPDAPRTFFGGGSAWQWVEDCEGDARHNLQTNPLPEITLEELRAQNLVQ